MKWVLVDFKTAKEEWFDQAAEQYVKKIKPFVDFEIQHLKTMRADRDEATIKIRFEEKVLFEKIKPEDFVILLDEKGKTLSSIEFSKTISNIQQSGKKQALFVIGGAYGVSDSVKKRAQLTLKLSDFVMNHLVAEVVILEQFYRALTIIHRIPYHNS